jgi:hypothetical protein
MADRLFEHSLHGWWQNVLHGAANDVKALDRRLFSDPALGSHLQQIAEKYLLDVARINKDAVSAKARQEEYQSNDYLKDGISAFNGPLDLAWQ